MEKIPEHIEKAIYQLRREAYWYGFKRADDENFGHVLKQMGLTDKAEADLRRAIAAYIEAVREP